MRHVRLSFAVALLVYASSARADNPQPADPSAAQIEAVLGPQTAVQRSGPGQYVIDNEHVTVQQLLTDMLPQKENALRTMQDNIKQRQETAREIATGVSIPTKRAQCQKLALNSVDRTRCYQELEDLRDQQSQSAQDVADRQKDDELQSDRLQQEIDAIEQFKKQFGGGVQAKSPAAAK